MQRFRSRRCRFDDIQKLRHRKTRFDARHHRQFFQCRWHRMRRIGDLVYRARVLLGQHISIRSGGIDCRSDPGFNFRISVNDELNERDFANRKMATNGLAVSDGAFSIYARAIFYVVVAAQLRRN